MGLFRHKDTDTDTDKPRSPKRARGAEKNAQRAEKAAQGHPWTHGGEMGSKAIGVLLMGGILCGYVGVGVGWLALNRPSGAVAQVQTEERTSVQRLAGGYAAGFVSEWLRATSEDPGELGTYVDLSGVGGYLSAKPWEYRDLEVVSSDIVDEKFVNVLLSANVKETTTDEGDNELTSWPRRYWQVPISTHESGPKAMGFPTPVAAPSSGIGEDLAYSETLALSSEGGETVSNFLAAYLTGEGDITRFTSPDATFAAIDPAPYSRVDIIKLGSDLPADEQTDEGSELRVRAVIAAQNADERMATASYALTMTMRADRWEVLAIDDAPLVYIDSDDELGDLAPSPTPEPSTTPARPTTPATN